MYTRTYHQRSGSHKEQRRRSRGSETQHSEPNRRLTCTHSEMPLNEGRRTVRPARTPKASAGSDSDSDSRPVSFPSSCLTTPMRSHARNPSLLGGREPDLRRTFECGRSREDSRVLLHSAACRSRVLDCEEKYEGGKLAVTCLYACARKDSQFSR